MKILTIFLLYSSISFTQNKMTQTDQSLSSFLEGKNNSPPLDISMESFALATPFIEFGFSGFDQIGHDKLRPHLATAMIVQLPIIISKYAFKRSRPERQYNPRLWNTRFTPSFSFRSCGHNGCMGNIIGAYFSKKYFYHDWLYPFEWLQSGLCG